MYVLSSIKSSDHPSLFIDVYNIKLIHYTESLSEIINRVSKLIGVETTYIQSIEVSIKDLGYDKIYSHDYLYFIVDLNFESELDDEFVIKSISKLKTLIREESINRILKGPNDHLFKNK